MQRPMQRRGVRDLALDHPRIVLVGFLLVWGLALYGNAVSRKAAILERAILNEDDPFRRMDDAVQSEITAGFRGYDQQLPIVLRFPDRIRTRDDVLRIQRVSRDAASTLQFPVLSLATAPRYVDDAGTLSSNPYIPDPLPADFDVEAWKDAVRRDPSVYPLLVGRSFDSAIVVLFAPVGEEEITSFRRVVEFLEGRNIPWWEWRYKDDIVPPRDTGIAGTLVTSGLIDQAINVDNMMLVGCGIALTLPIFALVFRGARPGILSVLVVVLSGVFWTRGSIGILQLLGVDVKERVHLLAAYANCILQGVSFSLHKYESFHEASARDVASRREHWKTAQQVDSLIAFTAAVAIAGFATLYSFQVRAIRDFGLLSALGVAIVLFNSCVLLPAIDVAFGPGAGKHGALVDRIDRSSDRLAGLVVRIPPWVSVATVVGLVATAVWLVWPAGKLQIWTHASGFVRGTVVEQTIEYLRQPGHVGSPILDLLVRPKGGAGVQDPEFLRRASELADDLRTVPWVRDVSSVLQSVTRISSVSLGKPVPSSPEESAAVFIVLESTVSKDLTTRLYYPGGLRMSLHLLVDRSDQVGTLRDAALELARDHFPDLQVDSYGGLSLYPQWDRYIRIGKPLNVISSNWMVVMLCGLRVYWHNRRRRGLALRPIWGGVLAATPFVFAAAFVAIEMVVFGVPLDAATATTTALATSAAIDFTIYLLDEYQEALRETGSPVLAARRAVRRKGRVIMTDMVLNSLCFLPLLSSHFQPVVQIGWMMPTMLLACVVGTLGLVPPLLPVVTRDDRSRRPASAMVAVLATAAVLGVASPAVLAAEVDPATELTNAWNNYRRVRTEQELLEILIVAMPGKDLISPQAADGLLSDNRPGIIHKRAFRRIRYDDDGRDKINVLFSLPKSEAGTGLLVRRGGNSGADDQQLYLPAFRTVRRVPPTDTQFFMGTTLNYEDIRSLSGEAVARYSYERRGVDTVDGRACDVIVAIPRPDTSSIYSRRVIWLDPTWGLPLKIEFYVAPERLTKIFHASTVREVASGVHRADLIEVRDLVAGQTTLLITKERRLGEAIPDYVFTPEYLIHPSD